MSARMKATKDAERRHERNRVALDWEKSHRARARMNSYRSGCHNYIKSCSDVTELLGLRRQINAKISALR